MEESCRTDNLSVTGTLDINHLCRFRTQEYNKTILVLSIQNKGKSRHKGKNKGYQIFGESHLLTYFFAPARTLEIAILEKLVDHNIG